VFLAQATHEQEHALPLREDHHLDVRVVPAFFQDLFELAELGADRIVRVQDVIGIADHAHHRQLALQLVLLALAERAAAGLRGEPHDLVFVIGIGLFLPVR
jgi:hypothetical protein